MTLEQFNAEMDIYCSEITDYGDEYDEMVNFQYKYMTSVKNELMARATTPELNAVVYMLNYLINESATGQVVYYTNDKEFAYKVADTAWNELGEYMIEDSPQVYYESSQKEWAVDCMFGGYYCPDWDEFLQ